MAMLGLNELGAQATGLVGRIKPSERRLLALLALVALMLVPYEAFDAEQKAETRNSDAQAALVRLQQTFWRGQGGIAARVANEGQAVKAWSWTADNPEVGKVLIQNDIANLAEKAGLAQAEVKVAEKLQPAGPVELASIEVAAPFSWQGLSDFLTALDATGRGFILDQVQLPDDDKPRLKINLRAPLILSPPLPAKAAVKSAARPAAPAKAVRP